VVLAAVVKLALAAVLPVVLAAALVEGPRVKRATG